MRFIERAESAGAAAAAGVFAARAAGAAAGAGSAFTARTQGFCLFCADADERGFVVLFESEGVPLAGAGFAVGVVAAVVLAAQVVEVAGGAGTAELVELGVAAATKHRVVGGGEAGVAAQHVQEVAGLAGV